MINYRKTKTGTWVACGPAIEVIEGADITVTKRDGSTRTEHVRSVGRTFVVDGVEMVYGYLEARDEAAERVAVVGAQRIAAAPVRDTMCAECGERRGVRQCRDSSGLWGMCCQRCARGADYERSFA